MSATLCRFVSQSFGGKIVSRQDSVAGWGFGCAHWLWTVNTMLLWPDPSLENDNSLTLKNRHRQDKAPRLPVCLSMSLFIAKWRQICSHWECYQCTTNPSINWANWAYTQRIPRYWNNYPAAYKQKSEFPFRGSVNDSTKKQFNFASK